MPVTAPVTKSKSAPLTRPNEKLLTISIRLLASVHSRTRASIASLLFMNSNRELAIVLTETFGGDAALCVFHFCNHPLMTSSSFAGAMPGPVL